jgi:hypothetical protein
MNRHWRQAREQRRRRVEAEFIARSEARDGPAGFASYTLCRREEALAAWRAAYGSLRPPMVASARFDRWLHFLREANVGEEWGVRRTRRVHAARLAAGQIRARDVADVEEMYHIEVLSDVMALWGEPAPSCAPSVLLRLSIMAVQSVPRYLARLPLLTAEAVGTVTFQHLLDESGALFQDDPVLAGAVAERFEELLADEVGHVLLLLSLSTALERALFPLMLRVACRSRTLKELAGPGMPALRNGLLHWRLGLFSERVLRRTILPAELDLARWS